MNGIHIAKHSRIILRVRHEQLYVCFLCRIHWTETPVVKQTVDIDGLVQDCGKSSNGVTAVFHQPSIYCINIAHVQMNMFCTR